MTETRAVHPFRWDAAALVAALGSGCVGTASATEPPAGGAGASALPAPAVIEPDAGCAQMDGTYQLRFTTGTLVTSEPPGVPVAIRLPGNGPAEVIPPDAMPIAAGSPTWTSRRYPPPITPYGTWPPWARVPLPAPRSVLRIQALLSAQTAEYFRCYELHAGAVPAPPAGATGIDAHRYRLSVHFTIEPSGAVRDVNVRGRVPGVNPLNDCVAAVTRRLAFAPACLRLEVSMPIESIAPRP